MNIVDRIGKKQMEKALAQRSIPEFGAGDTVRVDVKVVELLEQGLQDPADRGAEGRVVGEVAAGGRFVGGHLGVSLG